MFSGQRHRLKRISRLIQVLVNYGFEDIALRLGWRTDEATAAAKKAAGSSQGLYARIRMVLEDLGPTYVKLGQAFSSREDLLPAELVAELKKLQDHVKPELLDVRVMLADELSIDPDDYFQRIEAEPFASASISQVYKAWLADGQAVILKIKRPGIRETVTGDLLIMKDVVRLLAGYSEVLRKLNLLSVLEAFEKTIYEELSFLNELRNLERFERNFRDEPAIHAVKTFAELSNDNILCMEFVAGVKINDRQALINQLIDLDHLVDQGLRLYLVQVLEHGFFHADPHAGNLFVTPDGRIAFIDMGSMGSMMPADQVLLEDFVLFFIGRDIRRLIATIRKMAIRVNITDEQKLERDIYGIFEMLDSQSLAQLDVKAVFARFSGILNDNEVLLPEHIYLLVRGIVLIEGIGRELAPAMNIIERVKPYVMKPVRSRMSPDYLMEQGMETLRNMRDVLATLPIDLPVVLHKLRDGDLQIVQQVRYDAATRKMWRFAFGALATALLAVGFAISTAIIIGRVGVEGELYGVVITGLALSVLFMLATMVTLWRWSAQ